MHLVQVRMWRHQQGKGEEGRSFVILKEDYSTCYIAAVATTTVAVATAVDHLCNRRFSQTETLIRLILLLIRINQMNHKALRDTMGKHK